MAADLMNPEVWSSTFGLADSPLFGATDRDRDTAHRVMLDGGHGTFALSVAVDGVKPAAAASWAWSSDIPHHVAVSAQQVTVTRWDQMREPRMFSVSSVSDRFDTFYRYLVQDRVQQSKTVVDHLVEQFRMVRTALHQAGQEDRLGLEVFLALLSFLVSEQAASPEASEAVTPDAQSTFDRLRDRQLAPLIEGIRKRRSSGFDLDLYSPLAVRHAGGLLFQEAHFELMRAPAPDLFGYLVDRRSSR